MEYAAKITEEIIRKSVYHWWKYYVGWHTLIITLIVSGMSIFIFIEGNRSWYVGVFGTLGFLGTLIFITAYYYRLHQSLKFLGDDNNVKYNFTQETLTTESYVGRSEIKWSQIKKVLLKPDVWLIFLSTGQYFTLPVETLSEEGRNYILTNIKDAGGKIV